MSQSGEGFPDDKSINCTTINDRKVPITRIEMSKEFSVDLSENEVEEGKRNYQKCYHVGGESEGKNPWWKGSFDTEELISSVELFNIDIKIEGQGIENSLLNGATVFIGDKKCG